MRVLFDRMAAVVAALVLLALGILTVVEVVHTALGQGGYALVPWGSLADFGRRHAWDSTQVRVISALVAGVGLLLLVAEVWPRRPGLLTLSTDDGLVVAATTRRSLRRALATRAADVDGVSSATVRVRRRTANVTAFTGLRDPGDLSDRISTALSGWLDSLALTRPLELRIRLQQRRS